MQAHDHSDWIALKDPSGFVRLVRHEDTCREGLDLIAGLACKLLSVPLAQVNVVLPDRQVTVAASVDDPAFESWGVPRENPIAYSYCRHVIETAAPLAISDATTDPLVSDNPSTTEGGVRAYAAVPLEGDDGDPIAALCVVDFETREWSDEDLSTLSALGGFLMREIRHRMRADLDMRDSRDRLLALVEGGEDLITVLDTGGEFRYLSPAYERILGWTPDELEGESFLDLVHPDDVPSWRDSFLGRLAEPSGRAHGGWRMRHRTGDWRWMEGTGTNRVDEPAVEGLVLHIMDVTRRKEAEAGLEQARKMEAVGRMAGGVAHDFNNLLTAVKGNATFLLERTDLADGVRSDVENMVEAVDRASHLARQLLSVSKGQVMEMRRVDVSASVERSVRLLNRMVGAGITVSTELTRDLRIKADEGQLGRIIMNLSVNARDAMSGGGTLRLETRAVDVDRPRAGSHGTIAPGRYALLVVADDGDGIPPLVLRRIFEPYFTTKEDGRGTGLGLSISWGIVTQMGGHIDVVSAPGKGTEFRIYFPLATAKPEEDVAPAAQVVSAVSGHAHKTGRILVVEDQPDVRSIIARVLEGDGHTVATAESGESALELLDKEAFPAQVLVTDVSLPGMSGPDVVRRLADLRPEIRVIFTSGFNQDVLRDTDLAAMRFVPKPFEPGQLSQVTSELLAS